MNNTPNYGRIAVALSLAALAAPAAGLDFTDVVAQARERAQQPYAAPADLPPELAQLDYDGYRDIEFRDDQALWPGSDFRVQFFSPGYLFDQPVHVSVIDGTTSQAVPYQRSLFDYGDNKLAGDWPADLGFAGFRLHYTPGDDKSGANTRADEVIAFLGASYFRARGATQEYGLSARGAAVDTLAAGGEEFPVFTDYWLRRPAPDAKQVEIYALMEGPSLAGAYRFVVRPGAATVVDVEAEIFMRADVETLGLAPLTSMYLYSDGEPRPERYLRPAVHDSDGLLIHAGSGEWLWRPLSNPARATEYRFQLDQPRGFGLMQRERDFDSYQSLTMHYQDRPSAWLTPDGDWGQGTVTLIELPTENETNDNIVAYWQTDAPPAAGESLRLAYRMRWGAGAPGEDVARVLATRRGRGHTPGSVLFLIDFAGGPLAGLAPDAAVTASVDAGADTEILKQQVVANAMTGGRRLALLLRADDGPLQLRAHLIHDDGRASEIWDYVFEPEAAE